MTTPAPHVTLVACRGRTAISELWSANSLDGVTLTVELLDPGIPGASTGRWEALPRARHPALALPLPVETSRGIAVALSPTIGLTPAPTNGDHRAMAALALAFAEALESLHGHGLGHNAITPSLLCATTAGDPLLAVTAACALPLDVTADLAGLRAGLARLDRRAYEHISCDQAVASAVTAGQLVEALRSFVAGPPALAPSLNVTSAPLSPPAALGPPPRLVPLSPPNGGAPSAVAPGRSRGTLPTRPLLIAGGVAIALVAGAAIAGAVTGSAHHVPPTTPGRTRERATVISPSAQVQPTAAVITATPSAATILPPPAATQPAAPPITTPTRPAPKPTHTHSATPAHHPTHPPSHSPTAVVPTAAAPTYVPPSAPVAPAPRPTARPAVTAAIPPPKQ